MNSISNKYSISNHSSVINHARSHNFNSSSMKIKDFMSSLTKILYFGFIVLFISIEILPCQSCSNFKTSTKIRLDENGYKNILIAIADDVEENYELIERIKTSFTEASELLFNVTK